MAGPNPLPRNILESISNDPRWIRAMENLLATIPSNTDSLSGAVEEVRFEAGSAMARAQQAIDSIPEEMAYGAFLDTTDQAGSAIDTPTAATFNVTKEAKGISVSGSQFTVEKAGLYKLEFRLQL